MQSNWLLAVITTFWLGMNFLLWRSTVRGGAGAAVPTTTATQRLLEAADSSTLILRQGGDVLGRLQWSPAVLQDNASATNQLADDGMVTRRTGYAVDVDLSLTGGPKERRGHGTGRLELAEDRTWRSVEFRWLQRPVAYEISAHAREATVRLRVLQGTDELWSQTLPLGNPAALLGSLSAVEGGFGLGMPAALGGLLGAALAGSANASGTNQVRLVQSESWLRWEAHTADLKLRRQRIPTFRLTGRFLDQYQAEVWIGRGGELWRVDLPGGFELRDARLTELQ